MKHSPEKAEQSVEKEQVRRSAQFENVYKKMLGNKEMYRLYGDDQLIEKDISRYVDSSQRLVNKLPAAIESNLKDGGAYGHDVSINLIQYAQIEARENLITLGLNDKNLGNRILAANAITFAPEDAAGRLSQKVKDQVGDFFSDSQRFFEGGSMRQMALSRFKYLSNAERIALIRLGLKADNLDTNLEATNLIDFVSDDEQKILRQELLEILTKVFESGEQVLSSIYIKMIASLPEAERAKFVAKAIDDKEYFVKVAAVGVIKSIPDENERLQLVEKAINDKDDRLHRAAIEVIPFAPETSRARLVGKIIEDKNPAVVYEAAKMIDLIPEEDRRKLEEKLAKIVPEILLAQESYIRVLGVLAIKYVPEYLRAELIEKCFKDVDYNIRRHAAATIEFASEKDRERLIRDGLTSVDETVRFVAAMGIKSISNPARDGLRERLREENNINLNNIASGTRLYDKAEKGFYKADFKKDGSRTTLLGRVPGFDDIERFKGEVIARHIKELPYLNWEKAYEAEEFWKKLGLDYVPVEPIVAVRQDADKYDKDFWEGQGLDLPASMKKRYGVFGVTVFSRVLNGPTVATWVRSFGPFQTEIFEQVEKIRQGLLDLGINHDHAHLNNFVIMFPRLADGTADISVPPRVYIIDFDQAKSSDKLRY